MPADNGSYDRKPNPWLIFTFCLVVVPLAAVGLAVIGLALTRT